MSDLKYCENCGEQIDYLDITFEMEDYVLCVSCQNIGEDYDDYAWLELQHIKEDFPDDEIDDWK